MATVVIKNPVRAEATKNLHRKVYLRNTRLSEYIKLALADDSFPIQIQSLEQEVQEVSKLMNIQLSCINLEIENQQRATLAKTRSMELANTQNEKNQVNAEKERTSPNPQPSTSSAETAPTDRGNNSCYNLRSSTLLKPNKKYEPLNFEDGTVLQRPFPNNSRCKNNYFRKVELITKTEYEELVAAIFDKKIQRKQAMQQIGNNATRRQGMNPDPHGFVRLRDSGSKKLRKYMLRVQAAAERAAATSAAILKSSSASPSPIPMTRGAAGKIKHRLLPSADASSCLEPDVPMRKPVGRPPARPNILRSAKAKKRVASATITSDNQASTSGLVSDAELIAPKVVAIGNVSPPLATPGNSKNLTPQTIIFPLSPPQNVNGEIASTSNASGATGKTGKNSQVNREPRRVCQANAKTSEPKTNEFQEQGPIAVPWRRGEFGNEYPFHITILPTLPNRPAEPTNKTNNGGEGTAWQDKTYLAKSATPLSSKPSRKGKRQRSAVGSESDSETSPAKRRPGKIINKESQPKFITRISDPLCELVTEEKYAYILNSTLEQSELPDGSIRQVPVARRLSEHLYGKNCRGKRNRACVSTNNQAKLLKLEEAHLSAPFTRVIKKKELVSRTSSCPNVRVLASDANCANVPRGSSRSMDSLFQANQSGNNKRNTFVNDEKENNA